MFAFMFKDMAVDLRSDNGHRMCFKADVCAMGGECGKEVLGEICSGSGGCAG